MLKSRVCIVLLLLLSLTVGMAQVPTVEWDKHSLIIDDRRVMPVMGEVHYSRIPAEEWQAEVQKMRDGGVTILACYVFWNHIEETEGVFRWDGQRNLRRFLEVYSAILLIRNNPSGPRRLKRPMLKRTAGTRPFKPSRSSRQKRS